MKRKQHGMTLIGFIMVMVIAGFFAYMGMVLGPAYSEYYSVVKAINFVAAGATPNATDFETMRKGLDRQFNVGYVQSVTGADAKLVREKTGNVLTITYEVRKPFVYNIEFLLKFNHSAALGSKTAGD